VVSAAIDIDDLTDEEQAELLALLERKTSIAALTCSMNTAHTPNSANFWMLAATTGAVVVGNQLGKILHRWCGG
jgi:hypothetical protein